MSSISGLAARLAQAVNRSASDSRMDEEFRFHLEMEAEHLESTGLSREEALRRARLSFGGREGHREMIREQRKIPYVEDFVRDLGYALRGLRKSPAYALAAVLTLALGIAGTTVTFGVLDTLFLRAPAGVVDADRLARLLVVRDEGGTHSPAGSPSSYRDFEGVRSGSDSFRDVAAYTWPGRLDLGRGTNASQVEVAAVSGNFFALLGVTPAAGRLFNEDDDFEGSPPVAVLGHDLWTGRFGADLEVVGSRILLKGRPVTVIGVARKGFIGTGMESSDLWVTSAMASDLGLTMGTRTDVAPAYAMIGRLRPGVTLEGAAAEAQAHLYRGTEEEFLDPTPGLEVIPLSAARFPGASSYSRTTLWLGGASVFLLLIACSSVGNMLLARGASRSRELAVRSALGAARGRLLRQLLTESLLLAIIAGIVAILVTYAAGGVVRTLDLPPGADAINIRVLAFAFLASLITALLAGLLPALKLMPRNPGSRLGSRLDTGSTARTALRKTLVGAQVGIACVLLVAAGLFVRSILRVLAVDPGVDPERVMIVSVDFDQLSYGAADVEAFQRDARERLAGIPGIQSSALAQFAPFSEAISMGWSDLAGEPIPRERWPMQNWVSPEYFETVGTDFMSAPPDFTSPAADDGTAVVSATMARLLEPAGDVVGECLGRQRIGGCLRIVGVVEDVRRRYLDPEVTPMVYIFQRDIPTMQMHMSGWGPESLLIRTSDSSPATPAQISAALQTLRPDLPYVRVDPLAERVKRESSTYRLGSLLFSTFGILAFVLAIIGTYGVLSYFVTERAPEFGIRRSIGAPAGAILRVTVREGFSPVVVGLAIGLTVAALCAGFLQPLLFNTPVTEPVAFAGAAAALGIGGLAAVLVPTWRALRFDPARSLRAE